MTQFHHFRHFQAIQKHLIFRFNQNQALGHQNQVSVYQVRNHGWAVNQGQTDENYRGRQNLKK